LWPVDSAAIPLLALLPRAQVRQRVRGGGIHRPQATSHKPKG
jgi:hypothetical protein